MEVASREGEVQLFNTPLESGIRILIVLEAFYPSSFDLSTLSLLDYFVVHAADAGNHPSVHPNTDNRSGEYFIRRHLVEDGAKLMVRGFLADEICDQSGISFRSTEIAAAVIDLMSSDYNVRLKEAANWLASQAENIGLENFLNQLRAKTSLSSVYISDIERLSGIEEGGFLLQKFAKMNCPLCGAVPEYQHHDHGAIDVEAQRLGVESEIRKIRKELNEIQLALKAADVEVDKRIAAIGLLSEQKTGYQTLLKGIKTEEIKARSIYLKASEVSQKLDSELENRRLLTKYEAQIQRISSEPVKARQRAEGLDINLNLTTNEANELSTVIKSVLTAWNYPGGTAIHFSPSDQDIVVDGKRRRDNGAGIRAILHSAFKVAVLLYCRQKGRPHPGFLILDAPLLAYRPAEETRYGDLTDEEKAVVKADLAGHFYRHLHGLEGTAQFIVIENHKSDQDVVKPFPNVQFTRNPRTGRTGFFH